MPRLKNDQRRDCPSWLTALDLPRPEALEQVAFPLKAVLEHSLYYPASGFDGRPVQFLAGLVHSFIYVDYGVGQDRLHEALEENGFSGYRILGRKRLSQADLVPQGWTPTVPSRFRENVLRGQGTVRSFAQAPFAEWLIFGREAGFGQEHGPDRFSLVYLGADGVATYQALYHTNRVAPLAVAIIQPGTGFGGNYTDFKKPEGFFAWTVLRAGSGPVPEYLVCGGMGLDYERSFWPDDYPHHVEWFQHVNGNGIWRHKDTEI
jgi:hypothetical protein